VTFCCASVLIDSSPFRRISPGWPARAPGWRAGRRRPAGARTARWGARRGRGCGGARHALRQPAGQAWRSSTISPQGPPGARPARVQVQTAAARRPPPTHRNRRLPCRRGSPPFFFPSRQCTLDTARVDRASKARADSLGQLRRPQCGIGVAELLAESITAVSSLWERRGSGLAGHQGRQSSARERPLVPDKTRDAKAERRRTVAYRLPVHAHPPHHFVL